MRLALTPKIGIIMRSMMMISRCQDSFNAGLYANHHLDGRGRSRTPFYRIVCLRPRTDNGPYRTLLPAGSLGCAYRQVLVFYALGQENPCARSQTAGGGVAVFAPALWSAPNTRPAMIEIDHVSRLIPAGSLV